MQSISIETRERINRASGEVYQTGIDIAVELIGEVKDFASGVYIMPPFGKYDLAAEIIDRVKE